MSVFLERGNSGVVGKYGEVGDNAIPTRELYIIDAVLQMKK